MFSNHESTGCNYFTAIMPAITKSKHSVLNKLASMDKKVDFLEN